MWLSQSYSAAWLTSSELSLKANNILGVFRKTIDGLNEVISQDPFLNVDAPENIIVFCAVSGARNSKCLKSAKTIRKNLKLASLRQ